MPVEGNWEPAEPWVPTDEELAQLAGFWVVKNDVCGHVLTAGPDEDAVRRQLAVLSGPGWIIKLGAVPYELELIARDVRCDWCVQGGAPTRGTTSG